MDKPFHKALAEAKKTKQEQDALNGKRESILPVIERDTIKAALARHFGEDEDIFKHLEAVNIELAVAATLASEKLKCGRDFANGFLNGFAFTLLVWDEYLRSQQSKPSTSPLS